jgi:hypothetical protein
MADGSTRQPDHSAAAAMLKLFASVGANRFAVTWTDSAGEPNRARKMHLAEITRTMPGMLDAATESRLNVIVRPYGTGTGFIQLDDLDAGKLAATAPPMFLTLETSPGNMQVWLATRGRIDREFSRRVRRAAGADLSASGATRIAGSLNFKEKYAPDYPVVKIAAQQTGRITDAGELERLGLVGPKEEFTPLPRDASFVSRFWPSYAKAIDGAPLNRDGSGPDRSRADFIWSMIAISWGHSRDATAARLMIESEKARSEGRAYADYTARNAAIAVAKRSSPQQPQRKPAEHSRR